jgi:hypothetical protein
MHNIHFTEKKGDLEFRDCKGHINCNPHSQATQLTTIKMRIYQVRYTCYLYFDFFFSIDSSDMWLEKQTYAK